MTSIQEQIGQLGRATHTLTERPEVHAAIERRVRGGATVEDAVLAEVHAHVCDDAELANEFLAYVLDDIHVLGRAALGRRGEGRLRRHQDSEDLAQSVLGDLGHRLEELEFRTKREFLSLLSQRLRWKALDHNKALEAGNRREDRRAPGSPSRLEVSDPSPSPLSFLSSEEECAQFALALARLPQRDAALLRATLRGATTGDLATEFSLTPAAAKRARSRAVERARGILNPGEETNADTSDPTTS